MPLFDWIRSDLHSLNLDWIISKIKTVEESEQGAVDAAADANSSKTAAAASATAANNSKNAAAGSATLAAVSAQQAQNLVDQLDTTIAQDVSDWLDEHITPTTPAVDDTLTVSGAAADAAVTGDKITELKSAIQQANSTDVTSSINLIANFIENGADTASNYYKQITALNPSKTYDLIVTVPEMGEYTIQAGTNRTVGDMVDTIFSGVLIKGDNHLAGYNPTGGYIYLRNDKDVSWSVKVYERFADIAPIVFQNQSAVSKAPQIKTVSTTAFANAPYNSTIGNLDNNSIVNITPSHNAIDFPFNISGYYTVITIGESSSPVQIAVDLYGRMYRRKKSSSGWRDWTKEAVEYSNLTLTNASVYSDFNDFPIGSIITVSNVELDNSPEGYANTGHDVMDVGAITANVMTFATTPYNPFLKSQICVYYRQPNAGKPRIAYRSAMLISGNYTWTPWSMMSEDSVIHATNRIVDINHLDYTFDDFDDAPINSIYQIDFNTGNSVAHNPAPGRSGSLMTYGFSNSSRHAQSQIYISRVSETQVPLMFFRYCVEMGTNEYQWSKWCQVQTTTLE